MPTVIIDGIELEITDASIKSCLESLTEIQRFYEEPRKHRAWAWDALNALAPALAELAADDPTAAYERIHGSDD